MQKEKEEAKQHRESLEKDKAKTQRQLEDTSSQVHTANVLSCNEVKRIRKLFCDQFCS